MRKYLLGLIISTGICVIAGAQTKKNWHWSMGPNIGYGPTWIDNFSESKYKSGGSAGLSLIYSTKSSFGVGVDAKYTIEGGEREYPYVNGINTKEDVTLNYVRVPIKAMWFFGKYGDRVRPKVALGPSFGFLVGGKDKVTNTVTNSGLQSTTEYKSKDLWDDFDLGLTGSAGINYRIVKYTWLTADISYLHGLTDAREDSQRNQQGYTTSNHYKNRNLQFNLGVNFGL
jgi:hypothetical protein